MYSILGILTISIFTLFSTETIVDESANVSENHMTLSTLSGTIYIHVDGSLQQTHNVSGTSGVNNTIRKLYVGNNESEGIWSGNASGASSICVEDSSPHEVRVNYTPNSSGFVINLYVDTTQSPSSYCF